MKIEIEVKNEHEAAAITTALGDRNTRALVVIMGALLALPFDRARMSVLHFLDDRLDEQDARRQS